MQAGYFSTLLGQHTAQVSAMLKHCPCAGHGALPHAAKLCHVGFPTVLAFDEALPMVTVGDVFTDLPEVSGFRQAEGAEYLDDPRSITQLWLRRAPPAGQVLSSAAVQLWCELSL